MLMNQEKLQKESNDLKMEKKANWFYAIKKAFTQHSKEKQLSNNQESVRQSNNKAKKKKKCLGSKLRNGEINSFLPIFRQPSSIEKILCEAEREHNLVFRPPTSIDRGKKPSTSVPSPLVRPASPKVLSQRYVSSPNPISPKVASLRASSPRAVSPRIVCRPEPTLLVQNVSATRIQAAFRGYMARRSFRALKGLVRLQGVVRGHSVKCQTMKAMKYMQLLVYAQTQQVQSCRFFVSEDWDDCLLMKKQKEARVLRKIDAMIKRERSMAYTHSHKDNQSNGFPLWWNWIDRQQNQSQAFRLTPILPSQSLQPQSSNQNHLKLNNTLDTSTPSSSKSIHTPQPYGRVTASRYSRGGRGGTQCSPLKGDDSFTSCSPSSSAPSYMAPTVSAKAKLRANSNPKERIGRTTVSTNEKRRT